MHALLLLAMLVLANASAQAIEPAWHDFDVGVSDELGFGSERVALLLRATVNGRNCHVQLDTGASISILWHSQRPAGAPPRPVRVTLRVGDVEREIEADAANLGPLQGQACAGVLATVGNAFFDHGTLTVDLGGDRFAFAAGSNLGKDPAAQPMRYLRSGTEGGHPLVDVVLDNGLRGQMLLDTGAARFGLAALNATQWEALSGGLPLKVNDRVRAFNATNAKDVESSACYEAVVAGHMTVAGKNLRQALVSYCQVRKFQLSEPLIGVLGLRPLAGRCVVIDYVGQRWLLSD
ncbi:MULTISPECIES: hypothetical protein [unclassified Janthinobacterium]|uniref:hypothetical protein n=1 Tax=unclassified Janthinobacterium TaxID=2610881 RepID=UPI00037757F4|nr:MULTISPECIES: hypothetical protein [unclassified Janthinobacterium]MEC5160113.1 hypothetical protein [Janthinobacterium sp. CG_S6]